MKLIIDDVICPGCNKDSCNNHQEKVLVTDNKTGLTFEAICACPKHKIKGDV